MMARTLSITCETAHGLRAGAIIAVLGGLRAEEVRAMSATATSVTASEFRADLQKLLERAVQVAAAESELETLAKEMRAEEKWWHIDGMELFAPLNGAVEHALHNAQEQEEDGLNIAQAIQDAIDVLDFAIKRDHLDENEEGPS